MPCSAEQNWRQVATTEYFDLNAHGVFTHPINLQIEPIEFTSSHGQPHDDL
jgi:hypothetical protein